MRMTWVLALLMPQVAAAESWVQLDGPAIAAVLTGAEVDYTAARQRFDADGSTFYDAGRPSFGRWRVDGGRYCSQWPPSDLWACYDVTVLGDEIRFIADDMSVTQGIFVE